MRTAGTLERAVARDSLYNVLGQGVPLAVALVAMPLLLGGLGEARFGVLGIAWMFVTFAGEVGFGRAVTRYVSAARASAGEAVRGIVRTGARAQLVLGVALGACLAMATPWLTGPALGIPPELQGECRAAFLWMAVGTPAVVLAGAHRGGLEGVQRFDLVNLIRGAAGTANFLLPLVALALGWGVGGVVGLLMASRVAVAVALFGAFYAAVPQVDATAAKGPSAAPDTAVAPALPEFLRFGGWVSLNALLSPILGYMDRVILAGVLGVAAVGRYVPPWEAIVRLGLVPASVMTALVPVFSALEEARSPESVRRLALRSAGLILVLTGVPALVAALWAGPLLSLWLGEAFHPDGAAALRILSIGVVVNALGFVALGLLQAVGRPELPAMLQIAEVPLQLGLAWLLISRFGVQGAAMAWSIRCGVDSMGLWLLALYQTRGSPAPAGGRIT